MDLEAALLARFVLAHPTEAARLLESMSASDVAAILADLPTEASIELLSCLNPLSAAASLQLVDVARAAMDLAATRLVAAGAILRNMQQEPRAAVLEALPPDERRALTRLLRHPEGTAGALMDPEVLSVDESASAGETLERLRRSPQHALYYVYVVDDAQRLVGVVNLRELMEARPEQPLGLRAIRPVQSLPVRASSESIVAHPAWERFHALPVVERDGRFAGVIRYESVRQLEGRFLERGLEDRATETASALGEVYALGLRGLFEWGASALLGSADPKGGSR
jgi:magnesium transporter